MFKINRFTLTLLASLLISHQLFANEFSNGLEFELAAHVNYLNADDYYELNTARVRDKNDTLNMGLEAGVFYDLADDNSIRFGAEFVNYGHYSADVDAVCGSTICAKETEIKHKALLATVEKAVYQYEKAELSAFAGLSYIFAKGEIKSENWSNNATGLHAGIKVRHRTGGDFEPFAGLRLHSFKIEADSDEVTMTDATLMFGLLF